MPLSVLCLLLSVPRVGLKCVIVAFPGHTHLLLENALHYLLDDHTLYFSCERNFKQRGDAGLHQPVQALTQIPDILQEERQEYRFRILVLIYFFFYY